MFMWLRIVLWAIAVLDCGGLVFCIAIVPIIDSRDRRRLVDAIKQRQRIIRLIDCREGE